MAQGDGGRPGRTRIATGAGFALVSALVGVAVGTVGFTFVYGRGASYLTDDPAACANCHVMEAQYSAWMRGSHRNAATCNDCHTPKGHVAKYAVKARNGFWHSFYFTLGGFHEPIRIRPGNREITEAKCRYCHSEVVDVMEAGQREPVSCLRCHDEVGHAN